MEQCRNTELPFAAKAPLPSHASMRLRLEALRKKPRKTHPSMFRPYVPTLKNVIEADEGWASLIIERQREPGTPANWESVIFWVVCPKTMGIWRVPFPMDLFETLSSATKICNCSKNFPDFIGLLTVPRRPKSAKGLNLEQNHHPLSFPSAAMPALTSFPLHSSLNVHPSTPV